MPSVGELGDARVAARRRCNAPEPRVELEVPAAGERAVDDRVLEHDARRCRAASGSRATSKPASRALPRVGAMRRREHADGRRLAGAVRPEQAEDLARERRRSRSP